MNSLEDKTSIQSLLKEFYGRENLDNEILSQKINYYPLGFISIPFYNSKGRQRAIARHDFNHLLTGFDSSVSGEAQLAAWEIASGFPSPYRVAYIYSLGALLPGLFICPIMVIKAFLAGLRAKNAYALDVPESEILQMPLEELESQITNLNKD